MISYSTPVTRGEWGYTSTKWWWYRFDFDAMVANGFGLGNDGVNDYYEIFCRASINLDNTSFPRDPTYVYFKAWKDTQSISASPILMSVIDINGRRASETPLASVRWTPATSTFDSHLSLILRRKKAIILLKETHMHTLIKTAIMLSAFTCSAFGQGYATRIRAEVQTAGGAISGRYRMAAGKHA